MKDLVVSSFRHPHFSPNVILDLIGDPWSLLLPFPFLSSLYVFSNSLTRFVDLFGGFPLQRLMRAHLIVVEQILLQFVPELRQGGERGAVDQVVVLVRQNRSTFPLVCGR